MTQDEIAQVMQDSAGNSWGNEAHFQRFAALIANAEREKVAAWMIQRGYATGHGDTVEDLLKELEWQIAENWTNALVNGVEGEREACAKVADLVAREIDDTNGTSTYIAAAIRARGQA